MRFQKKTTLILAVLVALGLPLLPLYSNLPSIISPGSLGLKALISNCFIDFSGAFIIIEEKDIFLVGNQDSSLNLECLCEDEPEPLPPSSDCLSAQTYSFDYNNSCPANKYIISLEGVFDGESYDSKVYFIRKESEKQNEVMVFKHCTSSGISEEEDIFGDPDFYEIWFTEENIHVSILNPALQINTVEGFICGCYYPGSTSDIEEGFAGKLQASPNPFSDELLVNWTQEKHSEQVWIKLYNISGHLVRQWQPPVSPLTSVQKAQLFTGYLPGGLYQLRIETPEWVLQQKIIRTEALFQYQQ